MTVPPVAALVLSKINRGGTFHMSPRLNTWIVMPAFNEEAVVGKTVETTIVYFPNIVVVDDCSSDRTGDLAHEAGAHVCRHSINLGQGAALQTGIDYALKQ